MTLDVNRSSQVLKGSTYAYNYDNGDKLTSITSGSSTVKSYGYDAAGRTHTVTTSAGTTTLSYDYEDRVTGITYPSSATNSFTYNGLDTRVGKVDSTGTSTYKRDGADVTDPVLSDGSIAYTPGVSERKSGTSTFDHGNYLGTYARQTNASQTTTATRVYDAFGNLESTTGSPQSGFGFVGGQGYQEDSNSGLKLLGHRYYDPSTGRFLTRDTAKDGRNWYSYCANNPLTRTDASGNIFGIDDLIIVAVIAVIAFVGTVVTLVNLGNKGLKKAKPALIANYAEWLDENGNPCQGEAPPATQNWIKHDVAKVIVSQVNDQYVNTTTSTTVDSVIEGSGTWLDGLNGIQTILEQIEEQRKEKGEGK